MPSSPPKQAKLDGFVRNASQSNGGSSAKTAINLDNTSSTPGKSSISNAKTTNKRPRPDGTDVPPEAKKSKASGTYKAFPNGAPDPAEDRVEGLTSILAKLEAVQKKAKPIKVLIPLLFLLPFSIQN